MKNWIKISFIIWTILLFIVTPCRAEPPTHRMPTPPRDKPKINNPQDKLGQKLTMFLPKRLVIHNFSFEVVLYDPGSTLDDASGYGTAKFGTTASDTFTIPFRHVKIEVAPGQPGQKKPTDTLGRIRDGEILVKFTPKVKVTMGTMTGWVTQLHLKANSSLADTPALPGKSSTLSKSGTNQVSLEVPLPTLWTRPPLPGGYTPAKQAYLYINSLDTTQDLDIILDNYKDHGLGEVGIGDTNIIMDCANQSLTVDLSTKQPAANSPALTGVLFLGMRTIPQSDRNNTNAGFCFGEYRVNGGLIQKGFFAKLELQQKWEYYPVNPLGYKITLDPGISQGMPINQNANPGSSAAQQITLHLLDGTDPSGNSIPGGDSGQTQGLPINPGGGSGNKSQQQAKVTPVNHCTLIIAKSTILKGSLAGKIILPKSLVTKTGDPVEYDTPLLNVDANLNLSGAVICHTPVLWGKCLNHQQTSYALQSDKTGWCYFPGAAGPKAEYTTTNGSQETFANPADLKKLPGITLTSFNLTVRTKDANLKEVYFPFETEFDKPQGKNIYQVATGQNQFWINFGTAGASGKINVEAKLAYDNSTPNFASFSVELGNPNPDDNTLTLLGGNYLPFKGYFHSNQWIDKTKTQPDGRPDAHSKTQMVRKFGPFFQADFVDSAVFDFGVDGHFFVDGPSNIYPMFDDLSATSTADLCSGKVTVNATLDYWAVDLETTESQLVPKVTQVFFLGATIKELKHYQNGFPVVWGQMIANGNIPEMLFGYTNQTFDSLAYNYRNVKLSDYMKPDSLQGVRGALITEGDVYFPYFEPQPMTIHDHNDRTPNLNPDFETRKIEIMTTVSGGHDFFPIVKNWGTSKKDPGSQQDLPSVAFYFPHVIYNDGPEEKDGFIQSTAPNLKAEDKGYIDVRDFPGRLPGIIHITGYNKPQSAITIPGDATTHPLVGNNQITLQQVRTDPANPLVFTSDALPSFKLLGNFSGNVPILGGFTQKAGDPSMDFAINVRPEASEYQVNNPKNVSQSKTININYGGLIISGTSTIAVTLKDNLITGSIVLEDVKVAAGTVSGYGSGGLGVTIGKEAQYIQGYATVTINGIPWPAPNSGGGAFFLGYGAHPVDVYAFDYLDRGSLGAIPDPVNGVYLACKIGYDYNLAGLGEAYIYIAGGMAVINHPRLIFQAGVSTGIEVCSVGLESSAYIGAGADLPGLNGFSLSGTLHYSLSLLFVEFEWSGSITLTTKGAST